MNTESIKSLTFAANHSIKINDFWIDFKSIIQIKK